MRIRHVSGLELEVPGSIVNEWGGRETGDLDPEWNVDRALVDTIRQGWANIPLNRLIDRELALFYHDFEMAGCDGCLDEKFTFDSNGSKHVVLVYGHIHDGDIYLAITGHVE